MCKNQQLKEINFHVSSSELICRRTAVEEKVDLNGGIAYKSAGVGSLGHAVDIASVGGADKHDRSVGDLTGIDGDVAQLCGFAHGGGVAVLGAIGGGDGGYALGIVKGAAVFVHLNGASHIKRGDKAAVDVGA